MIDVIKMIEALRRGLVESNSARQGDPGLNAFALVGSVEALDELERQVKSALTADYLGELYRTTYEVAGKGPFPIDMLRYTCSWPDTESDAMLVERVISEDGDPDRGEDTSTHTIRLQKYHRDPKPSLGEDRWLAKFYWKVVRIVETKLL